MTLGCYTQSSFLPAIL